MIYYGTVTRVAGAKLYVKVPDLGGTQKEFGPINSIQAKQPTIVNNTSPASTGAAAGPPGTSHTHSIAFHNHTVTNTHYNKGDKVVVAQVGAIPESLVVLGRLN